jgi:hypothetical protein
MSACFEISFTWVVSAVSVRFQVFLLSVSGVIVYLPAASIIVHVLIQPIRYAAAAGFVSCSGP